MVNIFLCILCNAFIILNVIQGKLIVNWTSSPVEYKNRLPAKAERNDNWILAIRWAAAEAWHNTAQQCAQHEENLLKVYKLVSMRFFSSSSPFFFYFEYDLRSENNK